MSFEFIYGGVAHGERRGHGESHPRRIEVKVGETREVAHRFDSPPSLPSFDRAAFEAKVAEKSPLLPRHFDVMLGDVAEKKALAWQIMCMPSRDQYAIWAEFAKCRMHFQDATVENVK